jgi:hypothetical protein
MSNGQDAVPTWEGRIKPMFAPYVGCMKGDGVFKKIGRTIDLSDYDDVVGNSTVINGMIKNKLMPPGSPLSDDDISAFQAWIDAEFPRG